MGTRVPLLALGLLLAALPACASDAPLTRDGLPAARLAGPSPTVTRTAVPEPSTAIASPELPMPRGDSPGAIAFKAELLRLLDWATTVLDQVARQCPAHGDAACTNLYHDARRVLYEGMGTLRIPPNAVASLCSALEERFAADWGASRAVLIPPLPLDPSGTPDAGAILDRTTAVQDDLAALRNVVLTQPGACR